MSRKAQVPKRKNDAQWHRLKIGDDKDQNYRDAVTMILMGINNDLSVDGLNLRLREAREDVNNAIHEEIDQMPHGIPRLHRPTAVKNLYDIFRDQRTTWPVANREDLLLDGEDEDSGEEAEGQEEDDEEAPGAEADPDDDSEDENDEPVRKPYLQEADSGVQEHHSTPKSASSSSSEEQPEQDKFLESDEDLEPFDYQSQYVVYNAQVDIIKAGDRCGSPSWTVNLSHFLERPELECQQTPDQKWINIEYVRFQYIEKALQKMKLLDNPGSSIWWSWQERDNLDWDTTNSTKGQVRLNNGWDLGRAIWRSFEGHFEDFRGPRPAGEIDSLPRDHDLPLFTLIVRESGPDFGVPLGNVPELEGMFDKEKSDTETLFAKSDVQTLSKSDIESDYLVTRLWKYISSSQTTSAEKRPRDESDESQPSGKRRKMAAPWEL
ncbi:uncharacterized protein N7503_002064 [Penicillium pulvis]|uniref:uncharacterized protein n=1 Tax=Penicillium pulvis TaxID=1562058 RepID=UPI00254691A6|nr:uncharacterized protein N7503_002064 [Penicillium pulvis]KAJ5809846.1 hypothetical protein N7503_002064 [Penicillium pulvis]